jgi:hypothetical protein
MFSQTHLVTLSKSYLLSNLAKSCGNVVLFYYVFFIPVSIGLDRINLAIKISHFVWYK